MWQPKGALPQSITLDLGQVLPDVGWLGCVPRYHHETSSKDGNVTSYRVLTSTDGGNFSEASAGAWAADGRMKVATFGPTPARYVRFEIRAANGSPAVTEITSESSRRRLRDSARRQPSRHRPVVEIRR
jgi:alpha-L-fucosidase